ncbi:MAG: MerR family transcriptional regulator [Gammaproteobacteria bacterium]|nr:MerR family transcriptional regulator [Gammaproteobacteria bacterium]
MSEDVVSSEHSSEPLMKIGVVARLTGVSAHTVRKWEERYGAVQPVRGAGGERLYSQDEVTRIALLKRLTDQGHGIRQLAGLALDRLRDTANSAAATARNVVHPPGELRVALLGSALVAAAEFPLRRAANIAVVGTADIDIATGFEPSQLSEFSGQTDALIIECPVVTAASPTLLASCRDAVGAADCVVAYSYSTKPRLREIEALGMISVRLPVDAGELVRTVRTFLRSESVRAPVDTPASESTPPATESAHSLSRTQLLAIASHKSELQCRCTMALSKA